MNQEVLDPQQMIGQCPGAHHLADDRHAISVLVPENPDGIDYRARRWPLQEIWRDHDLLRFRKQVPLSVAGR